MVRFIIILISCLLLQCCTHTEIAELELLQCKDFTDTVIYQIILTDKFVINHHGTRIYILTATSDACKIQHTGIYTQIEVDNY